MDFKGLRVDSEKKIISRRDTNTATGSYDSKNSMGGSLVERDLAVIMSQPFQRREMDQESQIREEILEEISSH